MLADALGLPPALLETELEGDPTAIVADDGDGLPQAPERC